MYLYINLQSFVLKLLLKNEKLAFKQENLIFREVRIRVKVLATLTSAEADRCSWDHRLTLNNRRQSIGPKPDSRPRLEGARYKYLTKLLMPTQPFLALQSRIHSHTSLTKLLPSRASALGLLTKGLSAWVQSRLDPCPKEQNCLTEIVL